MGRVADAYRTTPVPARRTGWRDASLCVIDLETTGLGPSDEIVAFATVPVSGGRVHLRGARYRTVRPERMPEAGTILVHGLRSEELVNSPPLSDVLDELIEAFTGTALVAHVASIEERFLGRALGDVGLRLRNPVIDTADLATELFERRGRPAHQRIRLTSLAGELGLPVHRPHQADGDALTTAQVFLALATELDAYKPQTIGSLSRLRRQGAWRSVRRAARALRSARI